MAGSNDQTEVLHLDFPRAEVIDHEPGCLPVDGLRMLACGLAGMIVGCLMTLAVLAMMLTS